MRNETIQEHSAALKNAHALMAQKDAIEAEIRELEAALRTQGVGMDAPLVDRSGFPRSDVDVVVARTARNKVIQLRNDHKDVMKQIEQALHAVHAENKAKMAAEGEPQAKTAPTQSDPESTTAPAQPSQPTQQPFAIVNAVAPDSPAQEAGLLKGDKFLQFGPANAENHRKLQALNEVVAQSENKTIDITVLRNAEETVYLTLTPRREWGGKGMLGCHILPL
ncbi:26S proteasome non-ATPase regulatory subunit 9-like protein [Jimgerdemannia flammicorona]|uniref:Probable 26S proteasome regulatory subunit p27 n=1 Tax=Jimgerdemannia flammicorona TaxID=994334 RepID=A0A433DMS1_9FUNG|nr:26S proteasome non-ATPase regulatory subunit 9-like protein [Jimgerdemannia flammicorona]